MQHTYTFLGFWVSGYVLILHFWTYKALGLGVLHTHPFIVAVMAMPPFGGHYYYNDGNATPSSFCPILEFLGKRKRERKVLMMMVMPP
jgi:hypothetical protein